MRGGRYYVREKRKKENLLMIEDRDRYIEHLVSAIVLLVLLIGCFFVLKPFISALLWALILTFSTWPVFRWWVTILKGNRTLAASVTTLLLAIVFVIPLVVIGLSFANEATDLISNIRHTLEAGLPPLPDWVKNIPLIGEEIHNRWQVWTADESQFEQFVAPYLKKVKDFILKSTPVIIQALFQILLSIFVCFFFYRDGEESARSLSNLLQKIAGSRAEKLIKVAADTTMSVVYGLIGTAVVQATLAMIGFLIAGVPGAILLGFLTFFAAFVPMGPPFIWLPVTVWLFYKGTIGWAIFMAIWGAFVISGVDNIVKPYLISRGGNLPFVLILLGVLGGVVAFGFIGVFLGPTLLALGYSLILEWTSKRETSEQEP